MKAAVLLEPNTPLQIVECELDPPKAGEVVYADAEKCLCRRWNWRQCSRTNLTPSTTRALFIIDALPAHP